MSDLGIEARLMSLESKVTELQARAEKMERITAHLDPEAIGKAVAAVVRGLRDAKLEAAVGSAAVAIVED